MTRRPAEIIAGVIGIVGALVSFGILDEPTGAWITAGVGLVPGIVTAVVEWYRRRPRS